MTAKDNPVPKKSLAVLAIIVILAFAPLVVERTGTVCGAVSAEMVNAMMGQVPEADKSPAVRAIFEGKAASSLIGTPWYQCSALYWVNYANPLPIAQP